MKIKERIETMEFWQKNNRIFVEVIKFYTEPFIEELIISPYLFIRITVDRKTPDGSFEKMAKYHCYISDKLDYKLSAQVYFFRQFLRSPRFRKYYLVWGENWKGRVQFNPYKLEVCDRCIEKIKKFNKLLPESFLNSKYTELQVFEMDKFSFMSLKQMKPYLPRETYLKATKYDIFEPHLLDECRWIIRGLDPIHAQEKVVSDIMNEHIFEEDVKSMELEKQLH